MSDMVRCPSCWGEGNYPTAATTVHALCEHCKGHGWVMASPMHAYMAELRQEVAALRWALFPEKAT